MSGREIFKMLWSMRSEPSVPPKIDCFAVFLDAVFIINFHQMHHCSYWSKCRGYWRKRWKIWRRNLMRTVCQGIGSTRSWLLDSVQNISPILFVYSLHNGRFSGNTIPAESSLSSLDAIQYQRLIQSNVKLKIFQWLRELVMLLISLPWDSESVNIPRGYELDTLISFSYFTPDSANLQCNQLGTPEHSIPCDYL